MESSIITELLSQGLLGIAVVVLGFVVRALYKRNQELVKDRDQLHDEYQKKLDQMVEKYIDRHEKWVAESRELAVVSNSVLSELVRRGGH